jgi:hypothetical protein
MELGRSLKYKGYTRESLYRKKFIVQEFIPGLKNDWKVLIYGPKYYVLKRMNRRKDFRASGSGFFQFSKDLPEGLLDHARLIFETLNIPNLSFDIATDGKQFYILEFQGVYFGNTTLVKSEWYFLKYNDRWIVVNEKSDLEKEYVNSIVTWIASNPFKAGDQR